MMVVVSSHSSICRLLSAAEFSVWLEIQEAEEQLGFQGQINSPLKRALLSKAERAQKGYFGIYAGYETLFPY